MKKLLAILMLVAVIVCVTSCKKDTSEEAIAEYESAYIHTGDRITYAQHIISVKYYDRYVQITYYESNYPSEDYTVKTVLAPIENVVFFSDVKIVSSKELKEIKEKAK